MRAAVLRDFGQPLRLESMPDPACDAGDIVVQVEACGVCHSDLHIADGDNPRFRALTKMPLILGHEVVGRVVEVGADVRQHRVGDRVGVSMGYHSCGVCGSCRDGFEHLCETGLRTGVTVDGGYAQYMRAKASHALRIPEGVPAAEAAPLFCAGVTVHRALRQAALRPAQRVAVVGVGGLGHLAVQVAAAFGAEVIAVDVAAEKLELASRLGAAHAFPADAETTAKIQALGGVHVALVTSAARAAYDAALGYLRRGGCLLVVGLPAEPLLLPALVLVSGEVRILGSATGTREDLSAMLSLAAAGRVRCEVETQPLEQVNDIFGRLRDGGVKGRVVLQIAA